MNRAVDANIRLLGFKDIMPEVNQHIIIWPYLLAIIALVSTLIWLIFAFLKSRKMRNIIRRDKTLEELKQLTPQMLQNKDTLYKLTINLHKYFRNDMDTKAEEILQKLERYKYHNKPISVDKKLIDQIMHYIGGLS